MSPERNAPGLAPSCGGRARSRDCPAARSPMPLALASPPFPASSGANQFPRCERSSHGQMPLRSALTARRSSWALAEAAVNEVTTFRARLSNGLAAVQEDVRGLEATARTLRNFQPGIIPGLLQTAEYARRILAFADETANVGAAVAARLTRQEILHEPGRSFEFLLTEAALRYRPGPREVLTAQLDHLAAVVTLEAISFGVIPADAEMTAITRCGFILYEDRLDGQPPFAIVETPHASLYANDPADVELYRDQLAAFRQSAVYGGEALEVVHRIAHPLA